MESRAPLAGVLFDPAPLEKRRILHQEADFALPPGPGGLIFVAVVSLVVGQIMMTIGFTAYNELYEGFVEGNVGKIVAAGGLFGAVLAFLSTVRLFK